MMCCFPCLSLTLLFTLFYVHRTVVADFYEDFFWEDQPEHADIDLVSLYASDQRAHRLKDEWLYNSKHNMDKQATSAAHHLEFYETLAGAAMDVQDDHITDDEMTGLSPWHTEDVVVSMPTEPEDGPPHLGTLLTVVLTTAGGALVALLCVVSAWHLCTKKQRLMQALEFRYMDLQAASGGEVTTDNGRNPKDNETTPIRQISGKIARRKRRRKRSNPLRQLDTATLLCATVGPRGTIVVPRANHNAAAAPGGTTTPTRRGSLSGSDVILYDSDGFVLKQPDDGACTESQRELADLDSDEFNSELTLSDLINQQDWLKRDTFEKRRESDILGDISREYQQLSENPRTADEESEYT